LLPWFEDRQNGPAVQFKPGHLPDGLQNFSRLQLLADYSNKAPEKYPVIAALKGKFGLFSRFRRKTCEITF
jgi:hypothetical protein